MIDVEKEQQAQRLLDANGLSQRAVARRVGLSRATVGAMAAGRRPRDYSLRAGKAKPQEANSQEASGPVQRCPGCGRLIAMPCRACRVERLVASGQSPRKYPDDPQFDEPLSVALQDEDPERYLKIRRAKEQSLLAEMTVAAEVGAVADPCGEEEPSDEELEVILNAEF